MKTTKLLLAPLLIVMGLQAKPAEETKVENTNVKTGTTIVGLTFKVCKMDTNAFYNLVILLH